MQGQKGASLETTRRIHRKLAKDLARHRQLLVRKQQKPGYDAAGCLIAETVQLLERQLSGASPPVCGPARCRSRARGSNPLSCTMA